MEESEGVRGVIVSLEPQRLTGYLGAGVVGRPATAAEQHEAADEQVHVGVHKALHSYMHFMHACMHACMEADWG